MPRNKIRDVVKVEVDDSRVTTQNLDNARKQKHWTITKDKFLSKTEYAKLRQSVRRNRSRDAILLKLFMFTAARANEGLAVRLMDLDRETKTVYIKALKGSSDREIPLPPWYFHELHNYAKKICKTPEDEIFPFCYTILHRTWRIYRPCNKKIHSLRHTLAITVYEATRDLKLVQILLGHRSIKNTMVYLDYVYNRQEMRRLLKVKY